MSTTYTVTYYAPDGCSSDESYPGIESEYDDLQDAVSDIIIAVGDHGTYPDVNGNLCYHESDNEGCGGFTIREVSDLPHIDIGNES